MAHGLVKVGFGGGLALELQLKVGGAGWGRPGVTERAGILYANPTRAINPIM